MMNLAPPPATRAITGPPHTQNGSAPAAIKTKICNRYNTSEGCKFGDNCNFAHGEWELGRPINSSENNPRAVGPISGCYSTRMEPPVPGPTAGFGVSATAKISVDASRVGAIIGKGGMNSKQICRQTGAKLAIREHDTDPNLRNIELEGTFEQIQRASAMLRELLVTVGSSNGSFAPGSNYKTKLCENFTKGSCTYGDRCHFAHGAAEQHKTGLVDCRYQGNTCIFGQKCVKWRGETMGQWNERKVCGRKYNALVVRNFVNHSIMYSTRTDF